MIFRTFHFDDFKVQVTVLDGEGWHGVHGAVRVEHAGRDGMVCGVAAVGPPHRGLRGAVAYTKQPEVNVKHTGNTSTVI